MGLKLFDGKELQRAWGLKISGEGKATQSTQAYVPWEEKSKGLLRENMAKAMRLWNLLAQEVMEEREIEMRERINTGRADRAELKRR